MIDNGAGYISRLFRNACRAIGLRHILTKPYTPRTNGKAERFIQTMLWEWANAVPFRNAVGVHPVRPDTRLGLLTAWR